MTAPEEAEEGAALIGVTGLIEIDEREPVAIEGSHLLRVPCLGGCGGMTVVAPGQVGNAACGGCRRARAGASAKITGLPRVSPPPVVGMAQIASRPVACPVCRVTKVLKQCKFTGYVPPAVPEMVCGTLCDHEVPGPVRDLCQVAEDHGWAYAERHSRGTAAGARSVAEMWSVRFRRGEDWVGYAVRRGDAWGSVCVAGRSLPPFLALGVTELREWLADPVACGEAWIEAIRRRVAAGALHKKLVRCPGAPDCVVQGPARAPGVAVSGPEHTHRADGSIVKKVSRKEAASGN